jgi:acetyl esterase/lipase
MSRDRIGQSWSPSAAAGIEEVRDRAALYVASHAAAPAPMAATQERAVPGPAGPVPVRLYRPHEGDLAGVLVWLHGGGFSWGSVEISDVLVREIARASGCLVVSVEYRLAPEHPFPAGLEDCCAVARWALDRPAELADLSDSDLGVAIGGESAGGNLAAAATLQLAGEPGERLDFQALVYPRLSWHPPQVTGDGDGADAMRRQLEIQGWIAELYLDGHDGEDPLAAPLLAPSLADLPPALVITAEYDSLRGAAERYAARLIEAGVPVEVSRYPGMLHGFLDFSGVPGLAEIAATGMAQVGRAVRGALEHRRSRLSA